MQAALALEAEESGLLLAHAGLPPGGGVHVAHREVTLLPQGVVGEVELFEVVVHILVAPVDHRQKLEAAALDGQYRQLATAARLLAAQPREPGAGTQLLQGALHGFDLVELVVAGDPFHSLLPQLAITRLLPGGGEYRPVGLQVEPKTLGQLVDKAVSLGEEITGIGQHHRNVGPLAAHQMQHQRRLNAKA